MPKKVKYVWKCRKPRDPVAAQSHGRGVRDGHANQPQRLRDPS